jgi:hypothetical protein
LKKFFSIFFVEGNVINNSSPSSPSPDQLILSSSFPPSPLPNINFNGIGTTSSSSSIGSSDNDITGAIAGSPCARAAANGFTSARDYAFADCSEVYLAGKRTSGIYEIW